MLMCLVIDHLLRTGKNGAIAGAAGFGKSFCISALRLITCLHKVVGICSLFKFYSDMYYRFRELMQ